jgi:hypothetical protein
MPTAEGEGPAFVVDEDKLAELFARLVALNAPPVSLDQFAGETETEQLASFVYEAQDTGALVRPAIDGEQIQIALHASDDADGYGLILGIHPTGSPLWWQAGTQLATGYEELDDYLERDNRGEYAFGEQAMRDALDYVVCRANGLLALFKSLVVAATSSGDLVQCRCVDPDTDERCGAAADGPDGFCRECRDRGCSRY